jgi:hypothetical protein
MSSFQNHAALQIQRVCRSNYTGFRQAGRQQSIGCFCAAQFWPVAECRWFGSIWCTVNLPEHRTFALEGACIGGRAE